MTEPSLEESFSPKQVGDLIHLLNDGNFQIRQKAQKELRQRGVNVLLELRHAMTDSRDSEEVHRLQNLIQMIQTDIDNKEHTRRLERQKNTLEDQSKEIQETLELWNKKLCQLRPTEDDCKLYIENWTQIQQYLFWLREKLNHIELQRSFIEENPK